MPTPRWPALIGLTSVAALAFGLIGTMRPAIAGSEPTASPQPAPARMRQSGCPTCHGNSAIAAATAEQPKGRPGLYVRTDDVLASVHGDMSCTLCHPALTSTIHANTKSDLAKARASCAGCHKKEAGLYAQSPHGSAADIPTARLPSGSSTQAKGDATPERRPSCVTCHGAHDIVAATTRSFSVDVSDSCAQCHVMRGKSFFERNYHGKGTKLGRTDVAGCPDCHGSHSILPEANPRSMVAAGNRLKTCRTCHPTAKGNFGDILVHLGSGPLPDDPKLATVTAVMTLIIAMTFTVFGTHTVLDIRHAWSEHQKATIQQGQEQ